MPEIEHMNNEVLNRVPAEFRPLLNLDHLTTWTLDRQRVHNDDHSEYEAARAMFQAVLRSQHVEGDGRWSALRRARKVEKHLNRLVKGSREAARGAEGLRTAYADYVRTIQALPGQRAAKAKAKADRRDQVNTFATKSLTVRRSARGRARPGSGTEVSSESAGQDAVAASGGPRSGASRLFDEAREPDGPQVPSIRGPAARQSGPGRKST
ncbi:Alanine-rich protein OS=Streptomyces fumanus OX=67302 GN=GCM10018772_70380 PE=4 SV=1 [Streptomyces fumanus]